MYHIFVPEGQKQMEKMAKVNTTSTYAKANMSKMSVRVESRVILHRFTTHKQRL